MATVQRKRKRRKADAPAAATILSPVVTHWRFSADDYHRMGEAGILTRDHRVELIEGAVVAMCPIGNPHSACVDRLTVFLVEGVRRRAIVRVQGPVRLSDYSEPQPDLLLLTRRADFYSSRSAKPQDVRLLIEVMDSSSDYDRKVKLELYARSAIREVWLVDLNKGWIEAYRRPKQGTYTEMLTLERGQSIAPEAFPDVVLEVDAILG